MSMSEPHYFMDSSDSKTSLNIHERTEFAPERVALSPGVEIMRDILNRDITVGVETLEGRIGPLIIADDCQSHFIDMPGGMYLEEHPHAKGSIIYTIRGRWVLCNQGRRYLMKPGSLFRFGDGVPTGYEVPFQEDAFILIFKSARSMGSEREFIEYLRDLSLRLEQHHREGVPFLIEDLPEGHPAKVFAQKVNPGFFQRG